jgi:ferredoxin
MSYTITEKCNGCGACVRICPSAAVSGEKKKIHAIDTGLCIECGACGRVCPQSALLDNGGAQCIMIKRSEWPKPEIALPTCVACGVCVDACPVGCLAMSAQPRSKGVDPFPYLTDVRACIGCGFCSRECPVDVITMPKPIKAQKSASEI